MSGGAYHPRYTIHDYLLLDPEVRHGELLALGADGKDAPKDASAPVELHRECALKLDLTRVW